MKTLHPRLRSHSVTINDQQMAAQPRETLLQAAIRNNVDVPYSCRVGACGTCKCRLVSGKVKELTETGYLLSADEIDQGYILACQSVPLTDVALEFKHPEVKRGKEWLGRIVGQERVTHDIVHLTVELDEPITYRAGQYAILSIEGFPAERSYSFASPSEGKRVTFLIRKVPNGAFSTLVNDADVVGRAIKLSDPQGEFSLMEGDEPLLFVAGGSGLAPVLAILEEAARRGVRRDVVLLFGAREQRDLYALDRIESVEMSWNGSFEFIPILSAASHDRSWRGERGLVTDFIPGLVRPRTHAYLCGPPQMIDAAVDLLQEQGVDRQCIRFDRFTTQADVATKPADRETIEVAKPKANLFDYLKYFLFHLVALLSAAAIVTGGSTVTIVLVAVSLVYTLGDEWSGDDTSTPRFMHPEVLTFQLWLALPLLVMIVFAGVWSVAPGDPLGFGGLVTSITGYDVIAAREATSFGHHVSAVIITGLMIGMVGTITAHELTHRTWDRVSMAIGRWLLAFSFDTTFSIEHVYGHHRYVSTEEDPATAPRGRNVYFHIIASTIKGNVSAWRIEADRLRKKHLTIFSHHNAMIRGHLMSVALVVVAFVLGGWSGALFFVMAALWGKSLLEIVNYMEHYGLVRDPKTPVQPRHSWNTNRRLSSWSMFNLTRHSHHHAEGEVPYQDLKPYPEAPLMLSGYLTTISIALVPPLWHHLMTPKLLRWDQEFATPRERELARRANDRSGISALRVPYP
jgi:NAD(P)H-flavin reductase/ferredoxin